MAWIDRVTHRFARFSLYFFWTCVLLGLAFCTFVGISVCSGH